MNFGGTMVLNITTFSITTFSIMALKKRKLSRTIKKLGTEQNVTQYNDTQQHNKKHKTQQIENLTGSIYNMRILMIIYWFI